MRNIRAAESARRDFDEMGADVSRLNMDVLERIVMRNAKILTRLERQLRKASSTASA
jgi:hypothetical protein